MRFTENHTRAILDGRKTMARVIARERVVGGGRRSNGTTYDTRPFVPHVGMRISFTYSAPRIDPEMGYVINPDHREKAYLIVTACPNEPVPVGGITTADAKAENHRNIDAFKEWWVEQHDKPWVERRRGRALAKGDAFSRRQLRQRFDDRHAATLVWPFTFELGRDSLSVALAPFGRGDDRGYNVGEPVSDRAARPNQTAPFSPTSVVDEPTPIDPTTLSAAWAETSRARHHDVRGEELARRLAKSVGNTIRENLLAAARAGHDITDDVAALQRAVEEIEHRRTMAA